MVAKINVGTSLYGALAYNGLKVNEGEGKLLAVNKVFDDGSGRVDIARAVEDFRRYMPENVRTRNKVIHISLNPHPDDRLTDMEMEQLAREYLEKLGYGDQPFLIFKHEDINRQRKYGLHPADRRQHRHDNPLRKVDVSQGDVKRQVANTAKAVMAAYKFQTMGEYRALLSLYNVTVEEARGNVDGREYHGLVYAATDDAGNRVGNPFKASRIGKSVGYEAVLRRFEFSKGQIRATSVWRTGHARPSPPRSPGHTARRSSSTCFAQRAWMWCSATRTRGASTGRPSSTTARAAC